MQRLCHEIKCIFDLRCILYTLYLQYSQQSIKCNILLNNLKIMVLLNLLTSWRNFVILIQSRFTRTSWNELQLNYIKKMLSMHHYLSITHLHFSSREFNPFRHMFDRWISFKERQGQKLTITTTLWFLTLKFRT